MTGIILYGSYLPFYRLARSSFGGGRGQKCVAAYDEDAVSMAVEAAREALRGASAAPANLLFATTSPPYAEKLNSAAIASALNIAAGLRSVELGSCSRMGLAALMLGLDLSAAGQCSLVCASDVVVGAPGGPREARSGDGACAFITGSDEEALAIVRGRASATTELVDVWRLPEDQFARQWEERFGAEVLVPVVVSTVRDTLAAANVTPGELTGVIIDAANPRIPGAVQAALKLAPEQVDKTLSLAAGRAGVAGAGLELAAALDRASAGDVLLVVSAVDGCDALVLEMTGRIEQALPRHSVAQWLESKRDDLAYNSYLKWRGILPFEPPRRPEPERPAAPASRRGEAWKMAFTGGRCKACGDMNLPAQRVCVKCGEVDQMQEEAFADVPARVATYTFDHLAYSLQPPVLAAVVDFDAGGRISCELTDIDPADVEIGTELEMTFRRLYTGQGIHNYFWKARPRR